MCTEHRTVARGCPSSRRLAAPRQRQRAFALHRPRVAGAPAGGGGHTRTADSCMPYRNVHAQLRMAVVEVLETALESNAGVPREQWLACGGLLHTLRLAKVGVVPVVSWAVQGASRACVTHALRAAPQRGNVAGVYMLELAASEKCYAAVAHAVGHGALQELVKLLVHCAQSMRVGLMKSMTFAVMSCLDELASMATLQTSTGSAAHMQGCTWLDQMLACGVMKPLEALASSRLVPDSVRSAAVRARRGDYVGSGVTGMVSWRARPPSLAG